MDKNEIEQIKKQGYKVLEQDDYYQASVSNCNYCKSHGGKCHAQKGSIGYICKYFVKFLCYDKAYIVCKKDRVEQLELF